MDEAIAIIESEFNCPLFLGPISNKYMPAAYWRGSDIKKFLNWGRLGNATAVFIWATETDSEEFAVALAIGGIIYFAFSNADISEQIIQDECLVFSLNEFDDDDDDDDENIWEAELRRRKESVDRAIKEIRELGLVETITAMPECFLPKFEKDRSPVVTEKLEELYPQMLSIEEDEQREIMWRFRELTSRHLEKNRRKFETQLIRDAKSLASQLALVYPEWWSLSIQAKKPLAKGWLLDEYGLDSTALIDTVARIKN